MATNYGSIDHSQPRPRKKREKTLISPPVSVEDMSDEGLKKFGIKRLLELAKQNRAPSVAKSAATEILERVSPKRELAETQMTAADAARIADIWERHFGKGCSRCGHVETVEC